MGKTNTAGSSQKTGESLGFSAKVRLVEPIDGWVSSMSSDGPFGWKNLRIFPEGEERDEKSGKMTI